MTKGFQQAGIEVIAGINIDPKCKETYELNNKPAKFIEADIKEFSEAALIRKTGIKKDDENLIFIGCSPCPYWSIIKTDKTKAKDSKNLLKDFQRFVEYFNPGFVVIENVPGIFSKAESPLKDFINFLAEKGYYSRPHQVINFSHYGVPQSRKRFLLIASRTKNVIFPEADLDLKPTVRKFIGDTTVFPEVEAGHRDESDFCHTVQGFTEVSLQRMKLLPPMAEHERLGKIRIYKLMFIV